MLSPVGAVHCRRPAGAPVDRLAGNRCCRTSRASGPGPGSTTLPLVVCSRVRLGLNPEMNALATLFISVVTIAVIVVNRAMQVQQRRRVAPAA